MSQTYSMRFAHATYKVNKEEGYFPYFQFTLRQRIKQKLSSNVAVVGEPGISKSYVAWTLCLQLDKHFTIDQIVFTYAEYMKQLLTLSIGKPLMFDEPSYAMGKRDWYKQLNKVLVQTIESQRFKVHPLFIPIINMNLLDKTIRDHLIQFVIHVTRRGHGNVYRLLPSQWEDKTYHPFMCSIKYPLVGSCTRASCLGCRQLPTCLEFRAAYERKKSEIQEARYEAGMIEASHNESKGLTPVQLAKLLVDNETIKLLYAKKEKITGATLRRILETEEGIVIGSPKAYDTLNSLKTELAKLPKQ